MKYLIYVILSLLMPSLAWSAGRRVAVLVVGADNDVLTQAINELEVQGKRSYEALGFEVVVVGGGQKKKTALNPEELGRALGSLSNVEDLRLDFIGHGGLAQMTTRKDAPIVPISPERAALVSNDLKDKATRLTWVADDSTTFDTGSTDLARIFGADKRGPYLTQEDLRKTLQTFREKNPNAITTLNLLNCYSGAVAQTLRREPNTVIYSNSPAFEPALARNSAASIGMPDSPEFKDAERILGPRAMEVGLERALHIASHNGLTYYYGALSDPRNLGTFDDARKWANQAFRKDLEQVAYISGAEKYFTGRSPLYENVIGWCETSPPPSTSFTPSQQMLSTLDAVERELKDIISDIEKFLDGKVEGTTRKDHFQKSYDKCVENETERIEKGRQYPIKTLQEPPADKKIKYIKHLYEGFLEELSDSSRHQKIFDSFKDALNNMNMAAKVKDIDSSRKGVLFELFGDMSSGKVTPQRLAEKLKHYARRVVQDCASEPSLAPCALHSLATLVSFESMIRGGPDLRFDDRKTCSVEPDYMECMIRDGKHLGYQDFWWWNPPGVKLPDYSKIHCYEEPLTHIQRAFANLKLDASCVDKFRKTASEDEWNNLVRIYRLGSRDLKGGVSPTRDGRSPRPVQ